MAIETYDDLLGAVEAVFDGGDYSGSLTLLDAEAARFPDHSSYLTYLRACAAARRGDLPLAIATLRAANAAGDWFGAMLMRQTPSFQPYQGQPDFEALVAELERHAANERHGSLRVVIPPLSSTNGPVPLCVVLHGNGDTAHKAAEGWRALTRMGYLVVAVQSPLVEMRDFALWQDADLAQTEISRHVAEVAGEYAIDLARTLIAGFSMGGEIALHLALRQPFPIHGFMLLGPGGPLSDDHTGWQPLIAAAPVPGLRGAILLGDQDAQITRDQMPLLAADLNARGIPCQLEMLPGMQHTYPYERPDLALDWDGLLARVLHFIG